MVVDRGVVPEEAVEGRELEGGSHERRGRYSEHEGRPRP
jgi:hypothetical protein